jgi:bacterioferritin
MKGNAKVIAELNKSLSSELTAIVQYMVQAETCQNWGYARLGAYLKRRAIEEMHHAEGVIERIVFFDSVPKVDVALAPKLGTNVEEHLKADLADEKEAVHDYNTAVKVCAEAGDNASREMFEGMIKEEEGHGDFLESQLHAIAEMGIGTYLAQQLHAEK